jgi:hypothetical protein
MLEKRQRNNFECGNGRLDRDFKKQLRLRMWRTSSRNYRTPMQLEEENRIVSSTIELHDVIYWTFWKVRPPPKRTEGCVESPGTGSIRTPATLVLKKKQIKNGLVHGNGPHLINEPLEMTGLKEGAVGQLENNHCKD